MKNHKKSGQSDKRFKSTSPSWKKGGAKHATNRVNRDYE